MAAIICDNCGSKLAINKDRTGAFCISCGLAYSIEDLQRYRESLGKLDAGLAGIDEKQTTTLTAYEAKMLSKRAFELCLDGDFENAREVAEGALSLDGTCSEAYLALLLIENKAESEDALDEMARDNLEKSANYKKAMKHADADLKKRLEEHSARTKSNHLAAQKQREDEKKAAGEKKKRMQEAQRKLNGLSSLNFRVLDWLEDVECALVMVEGKIEYKSYDSEGSSGATWESCALRKWLNGDYLATLPRLIRNHIVEVENDNPDTWSTPGGPRTKDKVFLLSIEEAEKYFSDDGDRLIEYGNEYDSERNKKKVSGWWLRSPGGDAKRAAYVTGTGSIDKGGMSIGNSYTFYLFGDVSQMMMYTRPVFWIALPSEESIKEEREFEKYESAKRTRSRVGHWIKIQSGSSGSDLYVAEAPVDIRPFNSYGASNWRDSSLRSWLNNDFFSQLSKRDQERIVQRSLTTSGYGGYSDSITTKDKVFVLSYDEYCQCSKDVQEQLEERGFGRFWLRDPSGSRGEGAMTLSIGGSFGGQWSSGAEEKNAVVPAVWMKRETKSERESRDVEQKRLEDAERWSFMIHKDEKRGIGLFLSRDIVTLMPYGDDYEHEPWSSNPIRKWLNGEFYKSLPEEIKRRLVTVSNETAEDKTVKDKVFLLSDKEAEEYLDSDGARVAEYCGWNHAWWLRSRVNHRVSEGIYYDSHYYKASYVTKEGYVSSIDKYYRHNSYPGEHVKWKLGIRPAIWLKLES